MLTIRRPTRPAWFRLPAELRGPLVAGAGLYVSAWLFLSYLPYFRAGLYGDVLLYESWASRLVEHAQVPYRDFNIEYPPLALPTFMAPPYLRKLFGYHGNYYEWFRLELLVLGLLVLVAVAFALAALGASKRRAYAALGAVAVAPALLGPIALARYDYWPTLLLVAAVAALAYGSPVTACGIAAAGAAAKVFPIVIVPLALMELWRRGGARAVAAGVGLTLAVLAAVTAPLAIVAPHGMSWALHRQLVRPLQVESLGATFFAAAHVLGWGKLHVVHSAGSHNLVGAGPDLAATLSGIATVLSMIAVYVAYWRSNRTREQLVTACVAVVAAYIAFSKVFSPQYLVWLVPLVPLVAGRRGLRAGLLLLLVLGMTQLWEPYRYIEYLERFTPWLVWLVLARNLLVVALLGLLLRGLRPEPLTE